MARVTFDGPGTLQLEEGGKVYQPGDPMPQSLTDIRRVQLQGVGMRFTYQHDEPVVLPDGETAEMAAAAQIDPPMGGPAVVAAVEDMPKSDAPTIEEKPDEQPAPRASRGQRP